MPHFLAASVLSYVLQKVTGYLLKSMVQVD